MTDRAAPPTGYPRPPFGPQQLPYPGDGRAMLPPPDHGEETYVGNGRLRGKVAIVTGGDSGIGRAVAIAFAREGADVAIAYLDEHEEAEIVAGWVRKAGSRALLLPGDISDADQARAHVARTIEMFGKLDILVNNAAFQKLADDITEIEDAEWRRHFEVNVYGLFYMTKAAAAHLRPGSSIINTASINAKMPVDVQLAYSATKAAITNITANLAQSLGRKGVRVAAVLPGPIWTPVIPATMKPEQVDRFGTEAPFGRPGQPAELAGTYVLIASAEGSYMNGAHIAVAGGMVAI
ncbi:SDR family oxidoreductase [Beijerinckia sp. L45]|uniref:SDR family oxidoreductase n=1 Tax=Beijerinckia sp. L45 TaxID=1641855 RepID=UPI00131C8261|nr:SDR family oxidoreductase [Beijerinckia sp. L45]